MRETDTAEAVYEHVERTLGPIEFVLHELVSPLVHLDLFAVAPASGRPFRTILTCGMSELPMPGAPSPSQARIELFACLPESWPMDADSWEDEEHFWPLRLLKMLARLPHENSTWLWREHTVPNGDPPSPYAAGTALSGVMVVPPVVLPPAFGTLRTGIGTAVSFFGLLPLYAAEMELKVREGADALYDRFEEAEVGFVIAPDRRSAV